MTRNTRRRRAFAAHSPAAENVGNNEGVLWEILLRLPVKSLIRFKAVSKLWFSLISNPNFCGAHTSTHIQTDPNFLSPCGLFIYSSVTEQLGSIVGTVHRSRTGNISFHRTPSLSFLQIPPGLGTPRILQSCNGLLLCSVPAKSGGFRAVCNPTTRVFKILPLPKSGGDFDFSWTSAFTLAFDPLQSPHYKVICVKLMKNGSDNGNYHHQIFVYSSEINLWKSSCCFDVSVCADMPAGVFSNGAVHWICHERYICFDILNEEVSTSTLQQIHGVHTSHHAHYFGEWLGHLHCIRIKDYLLDCLQINTSGASLWRVLTGRIMRAFHVAMKRRNKDEQGVTVNYHYGVHHNFNVLTVIKKGCGYVFVLAIRGKVFAYDSHRKTVRLLNEMQQFDAMLQESNRLRAYHYIQILSPLSC